MQTVISCVWGFLGFYMMLSASRLAEWECERLIRLTGKQRSVSVAIQIALSLAGFALLAKGIKLFPW